MRRNWKCLHPAWVFAAVLCATQPACNDTKSPAPAASPAVHVGRCSLIGNHREANEDAVAVRELAGSTLCVAADGMGGTPADGRGATLAVEALAREFARDLPGATTSEENQRVIRKAIVAANEDILTEAARNPESRNIGASVVLAVSRPGGAVHVAGVGDSRAYLVRGDTIEQLTVDHTLALALVEAKTITPEEARTHRFRNVLWKYLGSKEVGDGPEVRSVAVRPGDRVILCTKGVHGVLPDDRLRGCVRQHADAQACADAVCQFALDAASRDNVSCIVIAAADGN